MKLWIHIHALIVEPWLSLIDVMLVGSQAYVAFFIHPSISPTPCPLLLPLSPVSPPPPFSLPPSFHRGPSVFCLLKGRAQGQKRRGDGDTNRWYNHRTQCNDDGWLHKTCVSHYCIYTIIIPQCIWWMRNLEDSCGQLTMIKAIAAKNSYSYFPCKSSTLEDCVARSIVWPRGEHEQTGNRTSGLLHRR